MEIRVIEPETLCGSARHGGHRQERHEFSRGVRAWWRKVNGWAAELDAPVEGLALTDAPAERTLRVTQVLGRGQRMRRLLEIGIFPGAEVEVVHSGAHGSVIVKMGETRLAVGRNVARSVMVEIVPAS